MSYNYRVLNDNPRHFFPLTAGLGGYVDMVGLSNGTVTGTPTNSPPLVVGGGNAVKFDGSNYFRFDTTIFNEWSVNHPFTLEAWFKPVSISGTKGIIGHNGQEDGITYDGEKVSFTTLHGAAGAATASYYPASSVTSFYVVGVHTGTKNELYVNGVRVAAVDLTDEQLNTPYSVASNPGTLYVGHLSGTVIVDSVAVYSVALDSRTVKLHFLWGRDAPDLRSVVSARGGTYWTFSDETADVALNLEFDTDAQWLTGQSASVRIFDDKLLPEFAADGTTLAGTWVGGVILGSVLTTVNGTKIEWDGDGNFTVQTSVNNGSTWSNATNGKEITGLPAGTASGTKSLQVRVTLPAGEPADTITRVRSLTVKLYRSRTNKSGGTTRDANIFGTAVLATNNYNVIEQNENMGIGTYGTGGITIPAGDPVRTIEFWIEPNSLTATNAYIFDTRTGADNYLYWDGSGFQSGAGSTYYINGQPSTVAGLTVPVNQWTHLVVVLPANVSTAFTVLSRNDKTLSMSARLGMLAAYPTALTASQVSALYNAHFGIPIASIVDDTLVDVHDAPENIKIYSYDWSLAGAA